jgi:hypothetical protein
MPGDDRLRLIALDTEDLDVVSAHVQDAVGKVGDVKWMPREKRFAIGLNRFVWDNEAGSGRRRTHQRRRAALHFERVESVQCTGIDKDRPEQVLSLLAVQFVPGDAPAGEVVMVFAGSASFRLAVECLEAQLTDLGPAWSTEHAPRHILREA